MLVCIFFSKSFSPALIILFAQTPCREETCSSCPAFPKDDFCRQAFTQRCTEPFTVVCNDKKTHHGDVRQPANGSRNSGEDNRSRTSFLPPLLGCPSPLVPCFAVSSCPVHWAFLLLVGFCLFLLVITLVLSVGIFTLCLLMRSGGLYSPSAVSCCCGSGQSEFVTRRP